MDNQAYFKENKILCRDVISIMIMITMISLLLLFNYQVSAQRPFNTGNNNNSSEQVHGGGIGYITCPDGSSSQANIAFVVVKSNGKILDANWSINELPSIQNPSPGFISGAFNRVNLSSNEYKISGQKINESQLCEVPVSIPISISGVCGQNVAINVQFESNDPILKTKGHFTGDVLCTS
jgi:hypothetical protein